MGRSLRFRLRYGIGHHIANQSYFIHKKLKLFKNKFLYGYNPYTDPYLLLFVDPGLINEIMTTSSLNPRCNDHGLAGEIKAGSWDTNTQKLSTHWKYKDFYKHFMQNESWENTTHYSNMHNAGISHDNIILNLKKYDEMFEQFKKGDYRYGETTGDILVDEVLVNIGRDGSFILSGGGNHRLCLAKIAKLNTIPVRVMVRHEEWQNIRECICKSTKNDERIPRKFLEYENHPDVSHLIESKPRHTESLV